MDGGSALLERHAALGDVAERPDPDEELAPVRARQQTPRPMAAAFQLVQFPPRRGDAARAGGVGKRNYAIGVADVEGIAQQRHAERLVQPFHKHVVDLGDAIAIRVAQ